MVMSPEFVVADVIFVFEGTANCGAYLGELKANYIIPTLEYFNGGPPDDRDCGSDSSSTLYTLVTFQAADCLPGPAVECYGPMTSIQKFLNFLDKAEFVGGQGESQSHITEGIAVALQCFEDLQLRREPNLVTQKHCILVCNSPPYNLPVMDTPNYSGFVIDQLAGFMNERNINLSILSPRKIPILLKLFDKAGGDLQTTQTKNYAKDPRHLVLLKGYSLQERPISPSRETAVSVPPQPLIPTPSSSSSSTRTPPPTPGTHSPATVSTSSPAPPPPQIVTPAAPFRPSVPVTTQNSAFPQVATTVGAVRPPTSTPVPVALTTSITTPQSQPVTSQVSNPTFARMATSTNIPSPIRGSVPVPDATRMRGPTSRPIWVQPTTGLQLNQPTSTQPGNIQMPFNAGVTLPQGNVLSSSQVQRPTGNVPNHFNPTQISAQTGAGVSGNQVMVPPSVGNIGHQVAPSTPAHIPNPQVSVGMMQVATQSKGQQIIWQGILEWHEKPKGPGEVQKMARQVPCTVSSTAPGGEPEVKAGNWPQKLIMQLIPKSLVGTIGGGFFKNSRSVLFHPQSCDALESLTKVMSTGFAGCVHFTSLQTAPPCDIKVLILLYSTEKQAYLGFIPNDQVAFVDRIRKVIQAQKNQQAMMQQRQSGQMPSVTLVPLLTVPGTNMATTIAQPTQSIMIQHNKMGGGQMTQALSAAPQMNTGPGPSGPVTSINQVEPRSNMTMQGPGGHMGVQSSGPTPGGQMSGPGMMGVPGAGLGPETIPGPGSATMGSQTQRPQLQTHPQPQTQTQPQSQPQPQPQAQPQTQTQPQVGILQLEADRQQNLLKIEQLRQTLEAAQQKELLFQQEQQNAVQVHQLRMQQQRPLQSQGLQGQPQGLQPQPQGIQQQRMIRPGIAGNPGLRQILQQQPQFRQRVLLMQQQQQQQQQQPGGGRPEMGGQM